MKVPGLPRLEVDRVAGRMAAGNHRERGSLEFPLEMSDQFLEKSATELTVVVKPGLAVSPKPGQSVTTQRRVPR